MDLRDYFVMNSSYRYAPEIKVNVQIPLNWAECINDSDTQAESTGTVQQSSSSNTDAQQKVFVRYLVHIICYSIYLI